MTDRAGERRRVSVLVVEDNPDHTDLIQRRLRDDRRLVTVAASGADALARLSGIDIVLLDYRLPDKTGLDVLQEIRRRNGPSVVMVTGMGSEEVAVEAMRAGAIDYIVKDSHYLTALPEVVERAFRIHDLSLRAAELQRIALIVSSAEDRESVFNEIVSGAVHLLRTNVCVLFTLEEERLVPVARSGEGVDLASLTRDVEEVLATGRAVVDPFGLYLPLSKSDEGPVGVLAFVMADKHDFIEEEAGLAETFAAFAGLALGNLRRRELEQQLIMELQQTLEVRKDFINSISHELRTPLACISGFSSTVLNHWGRLEEETIRTSVEKIRHHGADLTNLVERLLDFSDVEHGRFRAEVEELELEEHIDRTVEDLEPLLGRRPVEVEIEPARIVADPNLLHRIVTNLISNAVKASSPDDPISIRSRGWRNGFVCVEVADRGVGLDEEDAALVFEPFWRSRHSLRAAQRGSGIGLALVREYVRTMSGEVGVRSAPGEGAVFYFTLPKAPSRA